MDIKKLVAEMTLSEKASLCSGANNWDTEKKERLGLPKITLSDGPHGLRRQDHYEDCEKANPSSTAVPDASNPVKTRKAVGWPTASALAASFDRQLLTELGELLGDECLANDTQVLLGPGINIKRSPLCGRNFEYFSEDPYLTGELASAYVAALQKKGVAACVKHFAANNQEFRRMSTDSEVSERALREIYLYAFEQSVKKSGVKSVMCAYNLINGVYCCENVWLLTDVLRREWGFDGIVMTDWGAMNNRVKALQAGLELEMPHSNGVNDQKIVAAVENGELDERVLNNAVERLLKWIDWCLEHKKAVAVNLEEHHQKAGELAAKCAVLLKNDDAVLPISKDKKVAFIGSYAETPRIQGGGSSHINNYKIDSALDAVSAISDVTYEPMFADDKFIGNEAWQRAIDAAKSADVAVIFAGLPDSFESEGFDRDHLNMPEIQCRAIEEIAAVQENVVVVLHTGSPIVMPWLDKVKSVLNLYLSGEGAGTAAVDLLFGKVNPSGKLAETYPLRVEDTPTFHTYGKNKMSVAYSEDIFIGYRWYDARKMDVLFPFGYGLSYTTFALSNLRLSSCTFRKGEKLIALVDVKNTGSLAGAEVVQLYVGFDGNDTVGRTVRELKGFCKVELQPGETKTVSMELDDRSFSYFETRIGDWYAEQGNYTVYVGTSSRDLPLTAIVTVKNDWLPLPKYERLTVGDLLERAENEEERKKLITFAGRFGAGLSSLTGDSDSKKVLTAVVDALPLHSAKSFGKVSDDEITRFVAELKKR